MLDWLKCVFGDRRKECQPVAKDRRKQRMTPKLADAQLYESIDRFTVAVAKRREELLK